jgi:hypothetical protein
MSDQAAKTTKRVVKPKARKFYKMGPDFGLGVPRWAAMSGFPNLPEALVKAI